MEEECDSAPLKATNLVIQLFPDADSSLRHSAGRSALTDTQAAYKGKGATDDIKASEWHNTEGGGCVWVN